MKYVNSICNTCKFKSTCTESSNHVAECHGYKNDCKNCKSEGTCLDAPKGCTEYRETDEARIRQIEAEVKAHDERIRADERRKVLEWLANGNVFLRRIGSDTLTTIDELISEYKKEGNK